MKPALIQGDDETTGFGFHTCLAVSGLAGCNAPVFIF
jgi:hypothetical protein